MSSLLLAVPRLAAALVLEANPVSVRPRSGRRRRVAPVTGWSPARLADQLTPTEQRVAQLAASGLTNREIAERVFLSPKTVESNLARVYESSASTPGPLSEPRMATLEPIARAEDAEAAFPQAALKSSRSTLAA